MVNEIYILDENLDLILTIDEYIKLTITENIYRKDDFKLTIKFISDINDIRKDYYSLINETLIYNDIKKQKYLFTNDSKRIFCIESVNLNVETEEIEISGSGFLAMYQYRIIDIDKEYLPTLTVGEILCNIINDNLKYTFVEAKPEDNIVGDKIYAINKVGDKVYKRLSEIAETRKVGMKFEYDYKRKVVIFSTFATKDKTVNIAVSKDDENLINNIYENDNTKYFNWCIVSGENGLFGIAKEREDLTDNEVRQMYKKSSLKQGSKTSVEYVGLLESEAQELLTKNDIIENFDIEVDSSVDVVVGDSVVVKLDLGYKLLAKIFLVESMEYEYDYIAEKVDRKIIFGKHNNLVNDLSNTLGVE